MTTQETIREVMELPDVLGPDEFVVQAEEVLDLNAAIDAVNLAATAEIEKGFTYTNGVVFGLSITDQLNYNSIATVVNMGADSVTIHGALNGDLYHEVTFTSAEAEAFFAAIFAYVEDILTKYRNIKKLLLVADELEISQILEDHGITVT